MNARKKLVAIAIAAVIGSASFLSVARADAEQAAPAAAASSSAAPPAGDAGAVADTDGNAMLRTVDEAGKAVREVHRARIALFEGNTDAAAKLVSAATDNLGKARGSIAHSALMLPDRSASTRGDAKDISKDGAKSDNGAMAAASSKDGESGGEASGAHESWLPIETGVALAEGFVPAEQHQGALDQAGQQMSAGDQKAAVESLRLADIEVAVSAVVVPFESSLQHVEDAERLIGEQKYFEANLALKAVEDAITVETWNAAAIPVQGTAQAMPGDGAPSDATAPAVDNG